MVKHAPGMFEATVLSIFFSFKAHAVNLWLLIFSYILLYFFPSFSYAVLKHFRSLIKALASNKIKLKKHSNEEY